MPLFWNRMPKQPPSQPSPEMPTWAAAGEHVHNVMAAELFNALAQVYPDPNAWSKSAVNEHLKDIFPKHIGGKAGLAGSTKTSVYEFLRTFALNNKAMEFLRKKADFVKISNEWVGLKEDVDAPPEAPFSSTDATDTQFDAFLDDFDAGELA